MYLETIEALPIQVSGLNFLKNMTFLQENLRFSSLVDRCCSTINKLIRYIPDVVIPGDFHSREDLFDLDPIIKDKPDHFLCITGVPDNTPSLDFYKYQGAVYTRYVEGENNKGFLFQVIPSNSPLNPISYGTH